MPPAAEGLLLTMMNAAPGGDAEFNAWANGEHIPERKAIPGFRTALRFENPASSPRYLAIYDLDELGVLATPAYRAISGDNLSAWSKRVLAGATDRWRFEGSRVGAPLDCAPTGQKAPIVELLLIRWIDVAARCDASITATVDAATGRLPGRIQSRVFSAERNGRFDYLAIVESSQRLALSVADSARYTTPSHACILANVYKPIFATANLE